MHFGGSGSKWLWCVCCADIGFKCEAAFGRLGFGGLLGMIRWLHAWFLYGVLVRVSFACVCCVLFCCCRWECG